MPLCVARGDFDFPICLERQNIVQQTSGVVWNLSYSSLFLFSFFYLIFYFFDGTSCSPILSCFTVVVGTLGAWVLEFVEYGCKQGRYKGAISRATDIGFRYCAPPLPARNLKLSEQLSLCRSLLSTKFERLGSIV